MIKCKNGECSGEKKSSKCCRFCEIVGTCNATGKCDHYNDDNCIDKYETKDDEE